MRLARRRARRRARAARRAVWRNNITITPEVDKMNNTERDIIIFGCGGVGSWLAEWLVRQNMKTPIMRTLTLVDHDSVEQKNLQRQNFTDRDTYRKKTHALKERLELLGFRAIAATERIETEEQLMKYDKSMLAIITTDNQKSKNMIAKHFNNFIIGNCDADYSEVKTRLDNTDLNAWQLENGYTSGQDIQSNIRTAQLILTAIIESKKPPRGTYSTKVQNEVWITEQPEEDYDESADN